MRTDGVHNFDFLHGRWNVANRRPIERLVACDEWAEFPGTAVGRPLFGGAGNIDEIAFLWFMHSANSRTGRLDPPVVGRFANGVGDFYGADPEAGRPVHVHAGRGRSRPRTASASGAASTRNRHDRRGSPD